MAGYSGTPLVKKLGIKPGMKLFIIGEPNSFIASLDGMPGDITRLTRPTAPIDYIHIFSKTQADLQKQIDRLTPMLASNGMMWISWPKKASKVATDLDEAVVRRMGLSAKLVDIKVCAVDEVWSGHKFVIRVKDRTKPR